ncbi:hypothetical protein E2562_015168 [Oryza meyeriana var. granulata]|uniref:Uncharacterized protein n=1 Tax=Oryza meyeriana var. granulata TaxID=110450 RepID=A0A6G1EWM4_9ORYZ|nr:hypothetical protein E2562_015168 [Oryza meyeriana var. granulata]
MTLLEGQGYVLVEGALYKTGVCTPCSVEEVREEATRSLCRYAAVTKAWYDNKLSPRHFVPGDMVLRCGLSPGKL